MILHPNWVTRQSPSAMTGDLHPHRGAPSSSATSVSITARASMFAKAF
ncbi:hypothetical protein SynMEDNS5_02106 [Synechococcus sp. MEDNS5]|nr:hypothetical protein SynMEDNS5_02106 [Synechococcus sp. MEDNS5]